MHSWMALLALVALTVALSAEAGAQAALQHVDVFAAGEGGYALFRIPAIESAPDGSLLAFAEARKYNGGDPGVANNEIDLVLKRSEDGGATWSALQLIEHAGERWSAANPATVVDRRGRRVWVIYLRCRPGRNTETTRPGTDDMLTLVRSSRDNGKTWSDAVDITAAARDMADPQWACTVVGPGGAIQTRTGRLLAAAWKARPYVPFAIYSDDRGRTWHRGEPVPHAAGNECQVAELADGRILMDIRQNHGPTRMQAVSKDGGITWSEPKPAITVGEVACALERLPGRSRRANLLWTGPKGPGRANLIARVSRDDGETFGPEIPLAEGPAAYSDLAVMKDGRVGMLWERGNYKTIGFTALPASLFKERR